MEVGKTECTTESAKMRFSLCIYSVPVHNRPWLQKDGKNGADKGNLQAV